MTALVAEQRAALLTLAERVEQTSGPSREIDAEIWWWLADHSADSPEVAPYLKHFGIVKTIDHVFPRRWRDQLHSIRAYTFSLDVVAALIAERLPEWGYSFTKPGGDCEEGARPSAEMWFGSTLIETCATTPVLALLAAALRALASEGDRS